MRTTQERQKIGLYAFSTVVAVLMMGMAWTLSLKAAGAAPSSMQDLVPRTPTPTRTHTSLPSDTATATAVATRTSVPLPTITLIPLPTLTPIPPTLVPTVTPVPCINSGQIIGAITNTDPVQAGRLNRDGLPSLCVAPKTCPLVLDSAPRHYDVYTFANTAGAASCFTVNVNAGTCVDTQYIFSAAYLNRFNPASLCTNYLADIGRSPIPVGAYSFTVPAGANFDVVVYEIDGGVGCPSYSITITNCNLCGVQYVDVPGNHAFYPFVRCLACRDIISGYSDGTFRPDSVVTRGQLAKIVSNAANLQDDPGAQIYEDVPPTNAFYQWINRLSRRGIMGGYNCGGPGEPCGAGNRPYFRPVASATRAQTAKIVSSAAGFAEPPTGQAFQDVPPAHAFYQWIQRLAARGIMGGYNCGGPGEPCGAGSRPYFRPNNLITRGQSAKIVSNTFFPNCVTP